MKWDRENKARSHPNKHPRSPLSPRLHVIANERGPARGSVSPGVASPNRRPPTFVPVGHLLAAREVQTHQGAEAEEEGEVQHEEDVLHGQEILAPASRPLGVPGESATAVPDRHAHFPQAAEDGAQQAPPLPGRSGPGCGSHTARRAHRVILQGLCPWAPGSRATRLPMRFHRAPGAALATVTWREPPPGPGEREQVPPACVLGPFLCRSQATRSLAAGQTT